MSLSTNDAGSEAACFQLSIDQRPREVVAQFTIEGEPVSKARARFTNYRSTVRSYTPQKTKDGEAAVARAFLEQVAPGYTPDGDSTFGVYCLFFNATRQRRDVDNMIKLILDGLNKVAWADDNQVLEVVGRKSYWTPKEDARTEVMIYRISTIDKPMGTCQFCGKQFPMFNSTSKRKYCSKECDQANRRAKRSTECVGCGTCFIAPSDQHGKKYCSKECQATSRRTEVECSNCSTVFAKPSSQVNAINYCGDECRDKANETCKRGHPWSSHAYFRPDGRKYCGECHRQRESRKKAA